MFHCLVLQELEIMVSIKRGFKLIASNELLERRMNVQLANNIAEDNNAYIVGDITKKEIKQKIIKQVEKYTDDLDLLVDTPPCQGISVANHFKKGKDIERNSLVLQSISRYHGILFLNTGKNSQDKF